MIRLYITSVLSLLTIVLWSQDYRGKSLIENQIIQIKNDSLYVSFDLHVEKNTVSDCTSMNIIPELKMSDNNVSELPYIQINGNQKHQMYKRWVLLRNKKELYPEPCIQINVSHITDTLIAYRVQLPYDSSMDQVRLSFIQEVWQCGGQRRLFTFSSDSTLLHHQSSLDTILYQSNAKSNMQPVVKQWNIQMNNIRGYIPFSKSSSVPKTSELTRLKQVLSDVIDKQNTDTFIIEIKGHASPEGNYSFNKQLAEQRAKYIKEYIMRTFSTNAEKIQLSVSSQSEDWDGLYELVEQSDIQSKEDILHIIQGSNTEQGMVRLKQLADGVPYQRLYATIFPLLRRSEYQISYQLFDY